MLAYVIHPQNTKNPLCVYAKCALQIYTSIGFKNNTCEESSDNWCFKRSNIFYVTPLPELLHANQK